MHGDDSGHGQADRPAERRAVQDVQRTRAAPEADRVPDGVAHDARDSPVTSEREELELDARALAQRAEQPADDACRARPRLDER